MRVMSMGFLLPDDKAAVWRGPMVMSAVRTLTQQTAWAPLDILLLDMPPGTGAHRCSQPLSKSQTFLLRLVSTGFCAQGCLSTYSIA